MSTDMITDLLAVSILRKAAAYLARADMPNLQGQVYSQQLASVADMFDRAIAETLQPQREGK